MPPTGQVPESTGNGSKNHFYKVLFNRKLQNFEFFQNPSFKFDNIYWVYCTHEYPWKPTYKSLPELCTCIRKFSACVNKTFAM